MLRLVHTLRRSSGKIESVQVLRAFAALSVVLFHSLRTGRVYGVPGEVLGRLEGWGYCGVDVFFVISGYIMAHCQQLRPRTALSFFLNRLRRILPLYATLSLLAALLPIVLPTLINGAQADPWGTLLRSILFVEATPILFVGWTLNYEMAFYLLFALSLWLPRFQLQSAMVAIALVPFMLGDHYIVIEFAWGIGLGLLPLGRVPKTMNRFFLGAGLVGLLSPILFSVDKFELHRVIVAGIPAVFLVAGALRIDAKMPGWAVRLGDASYSIYLIQVFTISLFFKIASRLDLSAIVPNDFLQFTCLSLTVAAGMLSYWIIERPMESYFRRHRRRLPAVRTA